jgi:hypothetical protein
MVTLSNAVQSLNVMSSSFVTELGMTIDLSFLQELKQYSVITVTPSGILAEVNSVHSEKAPLPMELTVGGSETDVMGQPLNVLVSTPTTV